MGRRDLLQPAEERGVVEETVQGWHDQLVEFVLVEPAGVVTFGTRHVRDEPERLSTPRTALPCPPHLTSRIALSSRKAAQALGP